MVEDTLVPFITAALQEVSARHASRHFCPSCRVVSDFRCNYAAADLKLIAKFASLSWTCILQALLPRVAGLRTTDGEAKDESMRQEIENRTRLEDFFCGANRMPPTAEQLKVLKELSIDLRGTSQPVQVVLFQQKRISL